MEEDKAEMPETNPETNKVSEEHITEPSNLKVYDNQVTSILHPGLSFISSKIQYFLLTGYFRSRNARG